MKRRNPSNSAQNTSAASPGKRRSADRGHWIALSLQSGWLVAAALAIMALAAVAAYCNSFAVPLLLDDPLWISSNTSIRHLWPIWQVLVSAARSCWSRGRPVVSLTLAVNYALGGMNVWGYHAMNLAIHVLAAWTLFGVVRRTLSCAAVASAVRLGGHAVGGGGGPALDDPPFANRVSDVHHPAHRGARGALLSADALLRDSRGDFGGVRSLWYAAAVAACLLGMATKEVMVTAPLIVLLYDRTFLAGSFREAWRRRYGLYLSLAATWGVVVLLLISTGFYGGTTGFAVQKFTWWSYLLTQPGVIVHYLRLTFWPLDCAWITIGRRPDGGGNPVPGLVVLGLLGLTFWALVKRPAWGFLGAGSS